MVAMGEVYLETWVQLRKDDSINSYTNALYKRKGINVN
jgi:hypothetical protein